MKKRKTAKKHNKLIGFLLMVVTTIAVCASLSLMFTSDTVVCLDPGHGGDDFGAISGDRYEKDDNLNLANAVKSELEAKGIKVIMTRSDDEYISLSDRCRCANKKRAALFVALHRNSAESGKGVEIWINSNPDNTESELAQNILDGVEAIGISSNRGVKKGYRTNSNGNYYVNKHTNMPSCLVEMGFITSKDDNRLFDENLTEYAKAIAQAISDTLQN